MTLPTEPQGPPRRRVRALGLSIGDAEPGPLNAITDVEGVRVGHTTLIRGRGRLHVGVGPVRTGVTAVLPNAGNIFEQRVVGGGFILNGAGELSGFTQVQEWGLIETPILLTNTLAVGACSEGVVSYLVDQYPGIGLHHDVVIPVVGETDDSWLNDIAGRHVRAEHVYTAIEAAEGGPVEEGNVGGGTGMITCDFKGGIGTSSRVLPKKEGGYTVGVLVQSNFGRQEDLRLDGLAIGRLLGDWRGERQKRRVNYGSIIVVVATDAPLLSHQISRLCKRAALGVGRVGSYAAHGSGEIIVGFSTANTVPRAPRRRVFRMSILSDAHMDPLYRATIEATEESILNALCMATDMDGINNRFVPALPLEEVERLLRRHHPTLRA
jgi:D-aminopeptidase